MIARFFSDRLNVAWVVAAVALVVMLVFVPNEGLGSYALVAAAGAAIGVSAGIRIRDARRDRARRAAAGEGSRRGPFR